MTQQSKRYFNFLKMYSNSKILKMNPITKLKILFDEKYLLQKNANNHYTLEILQNF